MCQQKHAHDFSSKSLINNLACLKSDNLLGLAQSKFVLIEVASLMFINQN